MLNNASLQIRTTGSEVIKLDLKISFSISNNRRPMCKSKYFLQMDLHTEFI